jgi:hypothetical protein
MTALDQYQRLESTGLWRESAEGQRREVIVSVGEASVVITDKADRVLTHWSLPALVRINPGETPALYRPGSDTEEELELDDNHMVEAIERVRSAVERRRAHPGRLRGGGVMAAVILLVGLAVFWLPAALVTYTASVVPGAKRAEIGQALLVHIDRLTGGECHAPRADIALQSLKTRLGFGGEARIIVLAGGAQPTAHLPGGFVLVNRTLVEDFETAEVVAGYLLAEGLRAGSADPLAQLLRAAGVRSTFRLLTTGEMSPEPLRNFGETLLTAQAVDVDPVKLLQAFTEARIRVAPYAYAVDVTGETTVQLIEADPFAGGGAQQLLTDADWVSLQGICGE